MGKITSFCFLLISALIYGTAHCGEESGPSGCERACSVTAGPPGIPGLPGLPGATGAIGRMGGRGERGFPGPKGEKGATGSPGKEGERGILGPPGRPGQSGQPGLPGADGKSGFSGPQGPMGSKGDRGPPGLANSSYPYIVECFQTPCICELYGQEEPILFKPIPSNKGDKGEKGSHGEEGPPGELGVPGVPGTPGRTGQTGLPGPMGPIGPRGCQGWTGPKGDLGPPGPPGRDTGLPGPRGFPGPPVIRSQRGPKGFKGEPGPSGPKGDAGSQGIKGEKGAAGATGPKGRIGMRGRPGQTGVTYIHWGLSTCPFNAEVLFSGFAVVGRERRGRLLCIPSKPDVSTSEELGFIPEDHVTQVAPVQFVDVDNDEMILPCTLCFMKTRVTVFVLPGIMCPSQSREQYRGDLITDLNNGSEYMCVDSSLTQSVQWQANTNPLSTIEVDCPSGVEACNDYTPGQQLPCVVCTVTV